MKRALTGVVLTVLIAGCAGPKHVPEGDQLFIGARKMKFQKIPKGSNWKMSNWPTKRGEGLLTLWDVPNGSPGFPEFRLVPVRLFMYNWFYTEKEKGLRHWAMNTFGQAPITISQVNPQLKVDKVKNLFENYGHFGTIGTYQLKYNEKKNKALIYYDFKIPQAYSFRKVEYITDSVQLPVRETFHQFEPRALLKKGVEFDLDKVRAEKVALIDHFHNYGYYYLRDGNITILADTTVGHKQMDLRIGLETHLPSHFYTRQTIASRDVTIDSIAQVVSTDKYYHWKHGRIKRELIDTLVRVKPGALYSLAEVSTSVRNLGELGIFADPIVSFEVHDVDSLALNTHVSVQSVDATTLRFQVKGAYKNIGYVGPSLGVNFTQLNLFGGAENLSVDVDGFYNVPIGVYKDRISNASGFSVRSSITAPWLKVPFKFVDREYSLPKKFVTLSAEVNNRLDFFKLATWNASIGVSWKTQHHISHKLELIDATYSNIINATSRFDELTEDNPVLRASLIDQFIFGTQYSIHIDNIHSSKRLTTYFEGRVESSGNLLSLIGKENHETGREEVMGVPFSHFTQFSWDFRAYLKFGERGQLAFRNIFGAGIPYGNSREMPYIKQFTTGGTNSLRPITARTIGPGSYVETEEGEVNQVGDIKMEWNLEYRLKLAPRVSGALWSDLGNIWLLNEDTNRPGSGVRWNKLFQDSYMTAGAGLRIDASFLVLRLDYGLILYAPNLESGTRWVWQNHKPVHGPVLSFGLPY
jgi:outer membrane protein insertion porin family